MPTDANGVYSLPSGYQAETGAIIESSQHNPPLEDIAAALTARLPRSGAAPMTGPLKAVDGTSSAPGIAFASDPTFGFYKTGSSIASTKPLVGAIPVGLGPVPWTGLAAPPTGWVFASGQVLLRASYPDLWAFAQAQIGIGNSQYNNGNGATTFGIPDARGYVIATADNMGSSAGRLSLGFGAAAGIQNTAIAQSQLPNIGLAVSGVAAAGTFSGVSSPIVAAGNFAGAVSGSTQSIPSVLGATINVSGTTSATLVSGATASMNGGVGQTVFSLLQPTLALNSIIYAGAV